MFIIGAILFLLFPIWGIWIIISMMLGNSLLTPRKIISTIRIKYQFRKNESEYRMLLFSRVPYYKKLDEVNQTIFYKRVKKFVCNKIFTPVELIDVNQVDKLLIAASAVQLTFGLDAFILSRFHTIYVYPNHFYNKKTKNNHKGEVNIRGSISLSLHDFHLGNKIENDGVNLGLHEMAHALRVEQFLEQDTDDFFNSYFSRFSKELNVEMENSANDTFIRAYGKTNAHEFFAVCVENFFERPLKFKAEMPDLFVHFVILLNQDPSNVNTSFETSRDLPAEELTQEYNYGDLLFSKGFTFNMYIISGILAFAFKMYPNVTFPFLILTIYFFVKLLNYRKVYFYSGGILVKRWYAKTPVFYSFSRIVLALFTEGDIKQFVIKYRFSKQIKSELFQVKLSETEKTQLFSVLKSYKIGVKYVGKL